MTDADDATRLNAAALDRLRQLLVTIEDRITDAAEVEFHRLGATWTSEVSGRIRGELVLYPGRKSSSSALATRTGELAASMGYDVRRAASAGLGGLSLFLFSTSHYAATHEYGATIRPKRSRFLTIPLADAMTASGVPRWANAREADSDVPGGTFVLRAESGELFIAANDGEDRVKLLYHLHPGPVTIPPRLGMRTTLDGLLGGFERRLAARIEDAVAASGGDTTGPPA